MSCWAVVDGQISANEIILDIDHNETADRMQNLKWNSWPDEESKTISIWNNFKSEIQRDV